MRPCTSWLQPSNCGDCASACAIATQQSLQRLSSCRVINVKVSSQPVLFEVAATCTDPLPAELTVETLSDIPRAVLLAAQRLHDFVGAVRAPRLKLSWRRNPVAGLRYASERAERDPGGLLSIPEFVRAPSQAQRRWLQTMANAVGLTWAARFLYINSPLAGSDNLQKWAAGAYLTTLRGFRCAPRTRTRTTIVVVLLYVRMLRCLCNSQCALARCWLAAKHQAVRVLMLAMCGL
jgi:hypothetical protein